MERCDSTTRSILTKRREKRSRLEQHSLSIVCHYRGLQALPLYQKKKNNLQVGRVFIGVFFVTSTRNHREHHPLYLRAIIEDTAPLKILYRYIGTIAVNSYCAITFF